MKYQLKILIKNKSLVFWSLLFPLILGTFFFMAFSNLAESEKFSSFRIGVVGEGEFNLILDELEDLFVVESLTLEEANEKLIDDKIVGYYVINEDIELFVKHSNVSATIMKYTLDTYNIYSDTGMNIYQKSGTIIEGIAENNYFVSNNNEEYDYTVIFFYTLIGMVCMLAGSFGINAVMINEANLSKKGARVSVSPTNKFYALIKSVVASVIVQYTGVLIILFYLIFILKLNFPELPYILLISFIGCLAGISLGTFIGVSNKKDENSKNTILTAVVMTGAFLSGMMAVEMKYVVENNMPLLARINPVNMITDALLSLYYSDFGRFYFNLWSLVIFIVVMISLSYLFLRRKKYDSI